MKKYTVIVGVLVILLLAGCGYKEGVSTGERESFLYFSGDTTNVAVSIDDGKQFSVKSGRDNQYKLEPGKHTIRVFRSGKIIVEREIYLGDGVAKEIGVN